MFTNTPLDTTPRRPKRSSLSPVNVSFTVACFSIIRILALGECSSQEHRISSPRLFHTLGGTPPLISQRFGTTGIAYDMCVSPMIPTRVFPGAHEEECPCLCPRSHGERSHGVGSNPASVDEPTMMGPRSTKSASDAEGALNTR